MAAKKTPCIKQTVMAKEKMFWEGLQQTHMKLTLNKDYKD
jgi:hypothetical protein